MSRLDGLLVPFLHPVERLPFRVAECVFEALPAVRGAADAGGGGAFGDGQEVLFLDDGLDEADGQGGIAAVDVGDVVGVLLVDFVDDQFEDPA